MIIQNSKCKVQNYSLKCKIFQRFLTFGLLTLTFNFGLLTFNLTKANAASLSLGVYPPVIKIEVNPPVSINTPITIENQGEEPVNLKIQFKRFTQGPNENGEVSHLLEKDLYPWPDPKIFEKIQVLSENGNTIETVALAPQQRRTVMLHVGLLKDEPPGEYYFSIIFLANPDFSQQNESTLSEASGGIATNILLSIGPKGKAKGALEEFSSPFFLEKGPIPFTVRIKNTSDHIVVPQGLIVIKNVFGQTIGKVELLPVNILSDTIRSIPDSLQSPEATPPAKFEIRNSKFEIPPKAVWYESFLLGPYNATLTVALSDQGPVFKKTIYFFAFPLQYAIGLLIAIILILIIRKRLKNKSN
ncbi:MAG: hypothetical protein M1268_03860 [Patescibacteria group bacterium]|nr:hypothetical protein [Patescibacteria group bacterium]